MREIKYGVSCKNCLIVVPTNQIQGLSEVLCEQCYQVHDYLMDTREWIMTNCPLLPVPG